MYRRRSAVTAALTACSTLLLMGGCQNNPREPGQPWTIHVTTIGGPDQFERTEQIAESLKSVPDLDADKLQVIHDGDGGQIYYGSYERYWDPATEAWQFEPDPHPDLALIQSLTYDGRTRPFQTAMLQEEAGSVGGDPEWEASRADGHWALQVAVFYNTETFQQRRQAAVQYCEILRERGLEAYYHHGTQMSTVVLGAFPEDAMQTVQGERQVAPGRRLSRSEAVIVHPRLKALREQFPHTLENGHRVRVTQYDTSGEERQVFRPSLVVELPEPENDSAIWN